MHVPSPTTVTQVATAPVTREIIINTPTQLPEESKVMAKYVIGKHASRGLDGVTMLYDWASHRLTLRVGYKTLMLSETDDILFAVFKAIVVEFSTEDHEKGKHLFYINGMRAVLHYGECAPINISPSLCHIAVLFIP
jgi:hypothetical protein